jgi:hypothetical protein
MREEILRISFVCFVSDFIGFTNCFILWILCNSIAVDVAGYYLKSAVAKLEQWAALANGAKHKALLPLLRYDPCIHAHQFVYSFCSLSLFCFVVSFCFVLFLLRTHF